MHDIFCYMSREYNPWCKNMIACHIIYYPHFGRFIYMCSRRDFRSCYKVSFYYTGLNSLHTVQLNQYHGTIFAWKDFLFISWINIGHEQITIWRVLVCWSHIYWMTLSNTHMLGTHLSLEMQNSTRNDMSNSIIYHNSWDLRRRVGMSGSMRHICDGPFNETHTWQVHLTVIVPHWSSQTVVPSALTHQTI